MKVYLSSTLTDLQPEREAAREILSSLSAIVRENYSESDAGWIDALRRDIAESDVFVAIVGLRYGFIPAGQTKSIIHLE